MNNKAKILILVLSFVLLFLLDLLLGASLLSITDLTNLLFNFNTETSTGFIILNFRLPKALTAVLAGVALSVSGLQMQTVFRNPLAGPYILGISSGAGLGVAILVLGISFLGLTRFSSVYSGFSIALAACIGAALVLAVILSISTKVKSIMTVLILGMLIGSIISAIISILQYFSNETMLKAFVIWTMGSLSGVTKSQLNLLIPLVSSGLLIAFVSSKMLDGLLLGEEYARSLGINLTVSRIVIFTSTSILAGSITAFCGPIGFVGIVVPHISRMFIQKSNHKLLLITSVLIGANLMLISDLISNLPTNQILPINSVTALLGIPIIIWIILKNKKIMM